MFLAGYTTKDYITYGVVMVQKFSLTVSYSRISGGDLTVLYSVLAVTVREHKLHLCTTNCMVPYHDTNKTKIFQKASSAEL